MTDGESDEALVLMHHAAEVLDYFETTYVGSESACREAKHYREAIRTFLKNLEKTKMSE